MSFLEKITTEAWTIAATKDFNDSVQEPRWFWYCEPPEARDIDLRIRQGRIVAAQKRTAPGIYALQVRLPLCPPKFVTVQVSAGGTKEIPNPDIAP